MKNTLKCNITGAERVTNVPYLNKKADRLGISVEEYKANYVSKAALGTLKADIAETSVEAVAEKLGVSSAQVEAYVNYNGKNKFVPAVPAEAVTTDSSTTEETAELAIA